MLSFMSQTCHFITNTSTSKYKSLHSYHNRRPWWEGIYLTPASTHSSRSQFELQTIRNKKRFASLSTPTTTNTLIPSSVPRLESRNISQDARVYPRDLPFLKGRRDGTDAGRYLTAEVLLGDAGDHPDLPRLDLDKGVGGLRGEHPHRCRREKRAAEGGEAPPERGGHLAGAVHRREGGGLEGERGQQRSLWA